MLLHQFIVEEHLFESEEILKGGLFVHLKNMPLFHLRGNEAAQLSLPREAQSPHEQAGPGMFPWRTEGTAKVYVVAINLKIVAALRWDF